jgi:2-polyprenyl-6-hydroxyphenyl methylase/3-demethylubiquinone-9 3-methyltransferase
VGQKGTVFVNNTFSNKNNVNDSAEIDKFNSLSQQWWNPKGPLKTLHEINPLRINYITEKVPLNGLKVLDIGCGGGLLSEGMARKNAAVVGIDLAKSSIDIAIKHAREADLNIDYECVDSQAFCHQNKDIFDVVTCLELLEHVKNPLSIIEACAEAVKPGGAVFFSTINRNFKSFLMAILGAEHALKMIPKGTHEYAKFIRPSELTNWCRSVDLQPIDLTGLHFNPLTQSYWLGGNVHVNYLAHTELQGTP